MYGLTATVDNLALDPRATRPSSVGYGIQSADAGEGLLPWSWATERLAATRTYWLGSINPDGSPHAAPLWGVWLEDGIGLSTGHLSRKWLNLQRDPRCTVTTESGTEAVIVQGVMETLDPGSAGAFVAAYKAKYDFDPSSMDEPTFLVRPNLAFAFIDSMDRFPVTATRWTF